MPEAAYAQLAQRRNYGSGYGVSSAYAPQLGSFSPTGYLPRTASFTGGSYAYAPRSESFVGATYAAPAYAPTQQAYMPRQQSFVQSYTAPAPSVAYPGAYNTTATYAPTAAYAAPATSNYFPRTASFTSGNYVPRIGSFSAATTTMAPVAYPAPTSYTGSAYSNAAYPPWHHRSEQKQQQRPGGPVHGPMGPGGPVPASMPPSSASSSVQVHASKFRSGTSPRRRKKGCCGF